MEIIKKLSNDSKKLKSWWLEQKRKNKQKYYKTLNQTKKVILW